MKRRTLLRRTGALGALALAGCVSSGDGGGDDTTTAEPTTDQPTGSPTESPTPEPITVTDRTITTTATSCRSSESGETASVSFDRDVSTVTVTGVLHTGTPCHRAVLRTVQYDQEARTLSLDAAAEDTGEVCVQCLGSIEYSATITLSGGLPETVEIAHEGQAIATAGEDSAGGGSGSGDDGSGNDGSGEDGTAEPTPTLVSSNLEVLGRRPASGDGAAEAGELEFRTEASEVVVTGEVLARDGCETAMLESVGYDAETDTLSVAVVAETPESKADEACTQALEAVAYRVTVGFENAIPHTVEVTQEGYGGMSAAYGQASASAPPTTTS